MPAAMRTLGDMTRRAVSIIGVCGALCLPGCGEEGPVTTEPVRAVSMFGDIGLSAGQFNYPRAIDVAEVGGRAVIFVCDKTARIQAFDAETHAYLGAVRAPEWELGKPTGITVGAHPARAGAQALYVADTHYHRVLVYDLPLPEGTDPGPTTPAFEFGSYGDELGRFIYPTDVAVVADGEGRAETVYVSEYGGNDRVSVFRVARAADGGVTFDAVRSMGVFGAPGTHDGEGPGDAGGPVAFNRPQSIAVVGDELIVADACNHRIVMMTTGGDLISAFGHAGTAPGEFNYPYGLSVLRDGTLMVCEFGGSRLQRIDPETGESLSALGGPGAGEGTLANSWGAAWLGESGFVLDSRRNRVVEFDLRDLGVRSRD